MIVKNFQEYVEDERSVLLSLISSDLEGSFERNLKWDKGAVSGIVVSALQRGVQVKLVDPHGDVVMDTEQALALLPSSRASKISAAAGYNGEDKGTDYRSYPLIIEKDSVGRLEVKFLGKSRSDALTSRAGIVVLLGVLLVALLTSVLTMLSSRKQSMTARKSVPATDTAPDLRAVVPVSVKDKTTVRVPEGKPVPSLAVATKTEPESEPDDPLDADDEDMQPLAGDPDRISKIVKGLDGLAKAQALRSAQQKQPLELAPYLSSIIETTRASCPDMQVTFTMECSNDLSLQADPECLTGIMSNLLDNAVKAVKHDGTVTVSASEKGDTIEFAVRDTGCGIRRKALPHIFERFYRGSGNGIGLGLTIVKELVDACKGTIAVQSTRGKGSVFTVCIPRS
jgi:two-component sensor histidine kinase